MTDDGESDYGAITVPPKILQPDADERYKADKKHKAHAVCHERKVHMNTKQGAWVFARGSLILTVCGYMAEASALPGSDETDGARDTYYIQSGYGDADSAQAFSP